MNNRTLTGWILAPALTMLSAGAFAEDAHDVPSIEEQLEAAIVVIPEARPRTTVVDAGHFHLTVPADVVVSHNRLWDPNGPIEVVHVALAELTRADAAPAGSFVDFFWFPTTSGAEGLPTEQELRTRMLRAVETALPGAQRTGSNGPPTIGDRPITSTQLTASTPEGTLYATVASRTEDDGILVVYVHVSPASGPRTASIISAVDSFAFGPAPEPEPEAAADEAADEHAGDDHGGDDHAAEPAAAPAEAPADDHAGHDHDDHAGHNH